MKKAQCRLFYSPAYSQYTPGCQGKARTHPGPRPVGPSSGQFPPRWKSQGPPQERMHGPVTASGEVPQVHFRCRMPRQEHGLSPAMCQLLCMTTPTLLNQFAPTFPPGKLNQPHQFEGQQCPYPPAIHKCAPGACELKLAPSGGKWRLCLPRFSPPTLRAPMGFLPKIAGTTSHHNAGGANSSTFLKQLDSHRCRPPPSGTGGKVIQLQPPGQCFPKPQRPHLKLENLRKISA